MTPLSDTLRATIAARGPLPFRDFMERALYDPEHGYYSSGRAAIGLGGDFFTNVSVGSLFGALLADQFDEMWQRLGAPKPFTIVEQGAHRGDFARDALWQLYFMAPILHADFVEYIIVEPSPAAREVQQATLADQAGKVRWVASLDELAPFTGVHFSNELLDAFPVHLVKRVAGEWRERHVTWNGERFEFVDLPPSDERLRARCAALPERSDGYETEVNLAAEDWIAALAGKLRRGYVLAIDYGFSREEFLRPERTSGTLSAYTAHRREPDPLVRPGEIDLTAHVDFTTLSEAAARAGLTLAGFTDQHHFMVGLSRLHFDDTAELTPARQKELRALQTLMHPASMGRAFQAICLSRGVGNEPPLAGFSFARDARRALSRGDEGAGSV